ncbi:hypothetical protein AMTR_s00059p00141510 [Amborella trichopoda]|uniref:Homeobox-leucine zipper protein n=2 Tax=Amborella trichopoda TaxID=13333 RepID=U5D5T9_AMBTC|nr:hypothetical protein AMTR_s00059p00141510 [Amborella trichopoda]
MSMLFYSGSYPSPKKDVRQRRRRKKGKGTESELKKRRLSAEQVSFLEMNFGSQQKLESERKAKLASELGLDPRQVAVWFQNRRARWKNKQLEEDLKLLKSQYEAAANEKRELEAEVMELREKLSVAENEIVRLTEGSNVTSKAEKSSSPSSSLMGDFEPEQPNNFMIMPDNISINTLEWFNYYANLF